MVCDGISASAGCDTFREWFDFTANGTGSAKSKQILNLIWMATSWFIWLARNTIIFNIVFLSIDKVVESIFVNSFHWMKYRLDVSMQLDKTRVISNNPLM